VHLVSLWLDEFIEFTVSQLVLVPWTSSYEPFGDPGVARDALPRTSGV
jgi:hypothetical protein